MNKLMAGTAALLMAATTACGGSDTTKDQNRATAPKPSTSSADPADLFADAEMAMNQKMMSAIGANAADNWVRKMIEHHRGAVEMARIALRSNPAREVADMARQTIDKQSREIEDLQKMVQDGQPEQQSAALYEPSMREMQQEMMAAKGADASETWIRKMIAHHRGAISMVDVVLKHHPPAQVRLMAKKTKNDQQKEIGMLERMLRGEPMEAPTQASASSDKATTSSARASPLPPSSAPSARRSDAMVSGDMSNMSGMSGMSGNPQ